MRNASTILMLMTTALLAACGGSQAHIPPIQPLAEVPADSSAEEPGLRFVPSTTMAALDTVCGPAGEETCDGLDNDCDGQFDEGCFTAGPMMLVVSFSRGGGLVFTAQGEPGLAYQSPEPLVPCADDAPISNVLIAVEAPTPLSFSASSTCDDAHLSLVVLQEGESLGAFAGPIGTETTPLGELVHTPVR